MRDRGNLAEETVDRPQRRLVLLRRIGGGPIPDKHRVEIPDEALARRGLDANIGGHAGQHDGADATGSQDHLEIGGMERAIAMLGDDDVVRLRPHVAVIVAVPGPLPADRRQRIAAALLARRLLQPDVREKHVPVGRVEASHEDDEHARLPRARDQRRQALGHLLRCRDVTAAPRDKTTLGAEIVLHVDHDERSVRRAHLLAQRAENWHVRDTSRGFEIRVWRVRRHAALQVFRSKQIFNAAMSTRRPISLAQMHCGTLPSAQPRETSHASAEQALHRRARRALLGRRSGRNVSRP